MTNANGKLYVNVKKAQFACIPYPNPGDHKVMVSQTARTCPKKLPLKNSKMNQMPSPKPSSGSTTGGITQGTL